MTIFSVWWGFMVVAWKRCRMLLIAAVALASLSMVSGKAVAASADAFGQGDDGAWRNWHFFNPNQQDADSGALRGCNRMGGGCEIIARPSNTCFALAVMTFGNGYGWSTNTDRGTAVNEAMSRCTEMGGCIPEDSFCEGTAQNPDDEGKPWSDVQGSMNRMCGGLGRCYRTCPRSVNALAASQCSAVCNAELKKCMAFHRRNVNDYHRYSDETDAALARWSRALDDYTPPPPQIDEGSDVSNLPLGSNASNATGRGSSGR
jgi:hypothetical protein